ncbi:hypothetical protein C4K68_14480 [Pokkaliibacter plantistimulans]|uniref:N-acetyltransferase domain-containing protein n=1 Tax=Proteobacteria bacterium 228 TaxID=2083153 RepID=A0A2S5KPG9_9PROT|nr:GNAT family N-acetyltransferase [Pokkaliibacter plantistimulans]PPC76630.1 hypothetical protein C4K68_14480 [Pokkaliibacter plantistimulans]
MSRAPLSSPPHIQTLNLSHLQAIITLHHEVRALLDPSLIAAETDDYFADHLARCGRIYGIFADDQTDRLVAYGVLGLPGLRDPNFGTDQGLSESELGQVAHIDGAAVTPDWRGLGLHRLLIRHREVKARDFGRTLLLSTAAPGNFYSLNNLLQCELQVRGVRQKFGGERFLLRKDLNQPVTAADDDGQWTDVQDAVAVTAALQRGCWGWQLRRADDDQTEILFAPPKRA